MMGMSYIYYYLNSLYAFWSSSACDNGLYENNEVFGESHVWTTLFIATLDDLWAL
jgi:hypothetical protein